ncbi:MAG: type IV toxin-antitoxin system AbiEi family antitoxin domain-containing protein [Prevotellaceae bacterium]|jgi:hypothetical protein|nr:type IV toxin-antitoxin system AbiEi family antitoxin domain-containing protein [Prevotellaceae bacterium]
MDLIYTLYSDARTVFRLKDVAMLTGETSFTSLNQKLNYYVRTGRLANPRKGLYCKPGYNREELACRIFAPAYVSLEYVLQRAGVIFQHDSRLTVVSYLSREVEVDGQTFLFRKIKNELLVSLPGLEQQGNSVTIAAPERAFLDMLYLNGAMYFDNLNPLRRDLIAQILPAYGSQALTKRVKKILEDNGLE